MKDPILKAMAFTTLATVLLFAPSAAQDPVTPPIAGEYALAKVDEGALPILIGEKDGCRQEVTAGALAITADNKYTFETTITDTCADKVQEKKSIERGTVAAVGSKITFTPEPPAGPVAEKAAAPVQPPFENLYTGVIEGSELKVTLKTEKVLLFNKK